MPKLGEMAVRGMGTTSSPEFQVLEELYMHDVPLTESHLTKETDLSSGGVKTGLRRLIEKGFVFSRAGSFRISEAGIREFDTVSGDWH